MVSTRQHPRGDFPASEPSPTKKPARTSTASPTPNGTSPRNALASATSTARQISSQLSTTASSKSAIAVAIPPPSPPTVSERTWCHTASNLTVAWIYISIPLVIWDVLYILLRPHTMENGALHWPIWSPYEIYARIDKVYSLQGYEEQDGFGPAQGVLNAVEVVLYGLYASILWKHGVPARSGTGVRVGGEGIGSWWAGGVKIRGKVGNRAVLIGFGAAVMTLSKTVLYYFNEYYSGFRNVKHNDWLMLFFFYGLMNGLWVILPAYMVAVFGADILQALDIATEAPAAKSQ